MKNRKSLEANNQFISGWVGRVLLYDIKTQGLPGCILFTNVKPSQRVNDCNHKAWVAIRMADASVMEVHCDCMAGLGESCSHISALLFKVEAAVRNGYTESACTGEACKWNDDFISKTEPLPINKIKFIQKEQFPPIKIVLPFQPPDFHVAKPLQPYRNEINF